MNIDSYRLVRILWYVIIIIVSLSLFFSTVKRFLHYHAGGLPYNLLRFACASAAS